MHLYFIKKNILAVSNVFTYLAYFKMHYLYHVPDVSDLLSDK